MSLLHLRVVQMMPEKIKHQKYFKIRKCTKNMKTHHILRTFLILHFFDALKFFWDFLWLRYCLDRFITLKGGSNDAQKNKPQKSLEIRKGKKNVRNPHILRILPILNFFEIWKKNWDFIWLVYCLNEFIILKGCSNDATKNQTSKILKN